MELINSLSVPCMDSEGYLQLNSCYFLFAFFSFGFSSVGWQIQLDFATL